MKDTMKAMVYYGENDLRFEERPSPKILAPTDAIVKLTKTTICGTDLGIMKGKIQKSRQLLKRKQEALMAVFLDMKGWGLLKQSGILSKISKKEIKSLSLASAAVVLVKTAKSNLTPTV